MNINVHAAPNHPAYNDALRRAITRAACGVEQAVYFDGTAIFVRDAKDTKPEGAVVVCIAQRWDDRTVQLRFHGAHSEFINV